MIFAGSYKYFAATEPRLIRSLPLAVLTLLHSIDHDLRHRGNDLPIVCMIGRERHQHELRAVRQFNVCGIVTRRARPTSL